VTVGRSDFILRKGGRAELVEEEERVKCDVYALTYSFEGSAFTEIRAFLPNMDQWTDASSSLLQ